uniref:Putative RNA-directed DNA polymerase from transposon X-element n=1 Tax=Lygus hesperus TaxID=30085 RepID=A0A0A9WAW8_LYGHE
MPAMLRCSQIRTLLHSPHVSLQNRIIMYKVLIRPIWTYTAEIWGTCSKSEFKRLEQQQNNMLQRHIVQTPPFVRNETIYNDLNIESPQEYLVKHSTSFHLRNEGHFNPLVTESFQIPTSRRLIKPRYLCDIIT